MTSDVVVPAAETTAANGRVDAHSTAGFKALMLGSIGVVYGDIGTSPLYAFREAVTAASGPSGTVSPAAVLGVLGNGCAHLLQARSSFLDRGGLFAGSLRKRRR